MQTRRIPKTVGAVGAGLGILWTGRNARCVKCVRRRYHFD